MILIDTHVLAWLYEGLLQHIPRRVQERLNSEQVGVPPIVLLELSYLHEIGRVTGPPERALEGLSRRMRIEIADISAATLCRAAVDITWTRDPFDRLLSAHATSANLAVVTKDQRLLRHLPLAWWAD